MYYSKDTQAKQRLAIEKRRPERFLSTVTVHEIYKMALSLESRETAELKVALIRTTSRSSSRMRKSPKKLGHMGTLYFQAISLVYRMDK